MSFVCNAVRSGTTSQVFRKDLLMVPFILTKDAAKSSETSISNRLHGVTSTSDLTRQICIKQRDAYLVHIFLV